MAPYCKIVEGENLHFPWKKLYHCQKHVNIDHKILDNKNFVDWKAAKTLGSKFYQI